ncbi:MAG: glutathione S-transferase family protein [Pseudomonadota bacterium]
MPTTFYAVPVSNYCATVRLILQLKGVPFVERLPPEGYGSGAYKAIVPSGTVPALADDLVVVSESGVIAEYLDERYPGPALLPPLGDVAARARVRLLARLHDSRVEPNLRALFAHVDPAKRQTDVVRLQFGLFEQRLHEVEAQASLDPYLTGAQPTLADYTYPATLLLAERMGETLGQGWSLPPHLAAWWHRLRGLPAVAAMLRDYGRAVDAWIAAKQGRG